MNKGELQRGNLQQRIEDYKWQEDGILLYSRRVYVPNSLELRNVVSKKKRCISWNACGMRICLGI